MKRRELLRSAVAGAAGVSLAALASCQQEKSPAGAPAVITGKRVRWTLASSFPLSLDTIYGSAEVLAARLQSMSGGLFELQLHPAGEIVPSLQVMDAVQQGAVQIGHTASYYYTGKNAALAFDTCVPFGMNARQQNAWLAEGGGRALVDELYADFGIVTLPAGNTGAQMGGWFRREVATAADLQGLNMRIPGLGGKVMAALGATVQGIPVGEIYSALERGALDAAEWVGPYDDEKLGLHKVASFYYYPGWWEPGPSLSYLINRQAWTELSAEHQSMLTAACAESASTMQARYDAKNPPALARLIAAGTQLRPFSAELMQSARDAATQMHVDACAADPAYRRVHDSWDAFRKSSFEWFRTAELAYASFAFRAD